MNTKTILLAAAICAGGVATSEAQSVFSANAVGYVTLSIPTGFSMIANQLNATSSKVTDLLNGAPASISVFKFNSGTQSYQAITHLGSNFWIGDDVNMTLAPGEGVFIRNPNANAFNVTFVGTVPTGTLSNVLPTGFALISSQVPQSGLLATDMGFPIQPGDTIYLFSNTTGYDSRTFLGGGLWIGNEPIVTVGQAFFVKKNAPATWTRNFSVSN